MPSRRPPSQREPAYALHRLAGTIAQAVPGLKVKNAAPVRASAPNRTAPTAPSGAALLGYAEATVAFSTVTSDGSTLHASSCTLGTTWGTPGVSCSGATMTYCSDSTDSVYMTTAYGTASNIANGLDSDVFEVKFYDDILGAPQMVIVGNAGDSAVTGLYRMTSTSTATPKVICRCTGGLDRTYSLSVSLYIARFAA